MCCGGRIRNAASAGYATPQKPAKELSEEKKAFLKIRDSLPHIHMGGAFHRSGKNLKKKTKQVIQPKGAEIIGDVEPLAAKIEVETEMKEAATSESKIGFIDKLFNRPHR